MLNHYVSREGVGMRIWTYLYFPTLCLSALLACNKPSGQSVQVEQIQTNEKAPQDEGLAKPFCSIEMSPYKLQEEAFTLQSWSLKLYGLKSLTSRLMVVSDGKVNVANEVTYIWEKWEPSTPPASGQLFLVVHDGSAFGAKGKRLPSLAIDFQNGPRGGHHARNSGLLLEGDLKDKLWSSWPWSFEKGKAMIFSQLFLSPGDQFQAANIAPGLENAIATSKGGRTVLLVEMETKVRD